MEVMYPFADWRREVQIQQAAAGRWSSKSSKSTMSDCVQAGRRRMAALPARTASDSKRWRESRRCGMEQGMNIAWSVECCVAGFDQAQARSESRVVEEELDICRMRCVKVGRVVEEVD